MTTWNVFGASVRGAIHEQLDRPGLSAHGYELRADGTLVVAIAEGLGSAHEGAIGARLAIQTAMTSLVRPLAIKPCATQQDGKDLIQRAFEEARASLEETARATQLALNEYATTLLVAVCQDKLLTTGHIGDGVGVGFWKPRRLDIISQTKHDQFTDVVIPITAPGALSIVQYHVYTPPPFMLALLTSGLQPLAIDVLHNRPFAGFFTPLIEGTSIDINTQDAERALESFLSSERVRTLNGSAKTMLVVSRKATLA